jgi:transcriptional regulator with XRE-family HTH domain
LIEQRRAFGERLRRQRERNHITLESIAADTKVAASLFAGLERGDCSRWPGGMYSRSFIRGYASAVQLDPDDVAAEFAEYYDVEAAPATVPTPAATARSSPPQSAGPPVAFRLRLETDPVELRRRILKRVALAIGDLLLVLMLSAVVFLSTAASFWLCLSMVSLVYQVLSRVIADMSPTERLLAGSWRPAAKPRQEEASDDEPTVAGTASTIA